MNEEAESERFWGVICLHCSHPFHVSTLAGPPAQSDYGQNNSDGSHWPGPAIFLAWCPSCHHEAPYVASDIRSFSASPSIPETSARKSPYFERPVSTS